MSQKRVVTETKGNILRNSNTFRLEHLRDGTILLGSKPIGVLENGEVSHD